jgi:hypothetical protein
MRSRATTGQQDILLSLSSRNYGAWRVSQMKFAGARMAEPNDGLRRIGPEE